MMLLARLEPLPQVFKAILDSFLLIVLISPALYLFLFRPLMREIQSRERAEAALKTANSMLEQRVAERTAELSASNERLAKTASELTQAEEQERQRIAAGLHDLVGEGLVTARLRLGMLKAELPDERSRLVEEVRDQLKKVIETTRVLTFQISNPLLYEVGLGAALEALLMRLAEDQPFQAEFEADAELERLSDGLKVILYRVVSELLVNIVKHARAETVRLTIRTPDDRLIIAVEDDGVGFEMSELDSWSERTTGLGLFKARDRIGGLGGELTIESAPGRGTRAEVYIPLWRRRDQSFSRRNSVAD
jgi:signal transduction histidine kinase